MKMVDVLVEEYRRIDEVPLWSDAERTAARAVVRGVAARAGLFRSFVDALEGSATAARADMPTPFFYDERRRSAF